MRPALAGLALLMLAGGALAADDQHATTVGLTLDQQRLSNNSPDWHERTLQFQQQFAARHAFGIEAGETGRFGLHDSRLGLSYTLPLGARLTATLDAGASSTHHVLARHALGGELQYEFTHAWLLHGGARTASYDAVTVNQGLLGIEHYFSDFSWAANWRAARAFDTTANSFELRGAYYYGERNSIGVIAAAGQEAANVGSGVAVTQIRSLAVTGRHWLDRRWALNYSVGRARQGDFYSRNGVGLGIQYAF
jgi:YaiO family outer membrane protein